MVEKGWMDKRKGGRKGERRWPLIPTLNLASFDITGIFMRVSSRLYESAALCKHGDRGEEGEFSSETYPRWMLRALPDCGF